MHCLQDRMHRVYEDPDQKANAMSQGQDGSAVEGGGLVLVAVQQWQHHGS
jgi:hypothetical protein